ncbi:MAG TPA: hypothetical protein VFV72_09425 [Candidatus Limnocylindrales bacterium]|nr:hypothetical protein [Candidatus Limnocylindrales bacterium]
MPGARPSQPRTVLIAAVAVLLLGSTAAPAAAAGPRASALAEAATAETRLPASSGRSAAGGEIDVRALRSAAAPDAPAFAPAQQGAYPGSVRTSPDTPAQQSPRDAGSPSADAAIATTTTIQVTPANPVVYPTQIHVKVTVTPAPQAFNGFLPGIGLYVDDVFRDAEPLADDGTAEANLSMMPGTFDVSAQFGGLGDYQASASAPTSVTVIQKPDLAVEQGSALLQSSQGFEVERNTSLVAATSTSIAAGPTDIVTMNEREVRFFDRDGTNLFHLTPSQFFFFEPNAQANDAPRGPRIVFDELHDRWIATEVTHDAFSGDGHVYIFFTTTNNILTADWWTYRFDFDNEAPRNPAIGISSDKIAIGYDVATIDTHADLGSTTLVVGTAQLFAHPSIVNYNRSELEPSLRSWRPAVNRSAGNAIRAIGWSSASNPGHLLAMTATGTVTGGGVTFTMTDLTSGPTALPDLGEISSVGPTDAVWMSSHLWFVSTRGCLPTGDIFTQSCVRVTELGTSGGFSVQQDFVIGRAGYATFLGGIGLAGGSYPVITYSQASSLPDTVPSPVSTWVTSQAPGDPANSVHPPQLVAAGEPVCDGGPECIPGSWNLTQLPVVPDTVESFAVWQAAQISVAGGWATEATRISIAGLPPDGSFTVAGGRAATNSLRVGIAPSANGSATQVLISNSPTTAGGVLTKGKASPIDRRIAWSLADPTFGGSNLKGTRTVYLQWGDGSGNWSAVQHHDITVSTPLGADFVQLAPTRLLDTRFGNGLSGGLVSHVPRSFQVTGRGGVPSTAVAVTGNLTMTGQTTGGYVFLGPTATANPTSSTLNAPVGDTRANGVTVKLGSGGKLGAVFVGSKTTAKTQLIFDVTGYLLADDPTAPVGSTYVAIDPIRVIDSRQFGTAGRFYSHSPGTFCVTGCVPVPDDAVAVTGNLTVTRQSSAGYVFLGPTATANPTSSTLNFPKGDNRANNVTVALDGDGNLSAVFVGSSRAAYTDLIFDITGYFVRGPWGATFIPLTPTRILDTRFGTGLSGKFATQAPRYFAVGGQAGVPATGTVGIVGNVTIVGQTTGGYAFLGPTAAANPSSSTINVPVGDTRANGLDVALRADGKLGGVWVGGGGSKTDMIFDAVGYFR